MPARSRAAECRVSRIELAAPRAYRVRFDLAEGDERPYAAGQSLRARFLGPGFPARWAEYPITSCRYDRGFLEALVAGEDERALEVADALGAACGDRRPRALVSWPSGSVDRARLSPGEGLVLLAEAAGFAPALSYLSQLSWTDAGRPVTLLWHAETREGFCLRDELRSLSRLLGNLRVVPVTDHDPLWDGERGRLDQPTFSGLLSDELREPGTRYVVCAKPAERKACLAALGKLGVRRGRVRFRLPPE